MSDLYFKPSGKFTISGIALGLIAGFINGLILAVIYAYLMAYIPFIYLHFLLTIGYGLLLGFINGSIMHWGKVRNRWVSGGVALVVAAVSLYFAWAVWLSILLGKANINVGALEIARQPGPLWETIKSLNETGAWKLSGASISGSILWLVWIAEAVIILGGAVVTTMSVLSTIPFCEACKSWCRQTKEVMQVVDTDPDELKRRLEGKDLDYLKALGPKQDGARDWTRVDLYECPGCGQTNTLSVIRESLTVDGKGNSRKKGKGIMGNLLINKSDVSRLHQISQELDEMHARRLAGKL